jgi:TRAP-type C4-dicarboxylate transport system permease small subunit
MSQKTLQDVYVSKPALRVDALLRRWCRIMAATGGIVMTAVTLVTVASVISRALFNKPIPGDFELVELGVGIAVSFFLPYCQIQDGNVIVDLFTAKAPEWLNRILSALGDLMLLVISAIISWRMVYGCLDYKEYNEVTMVLHIPLWWAMVPMIGAFVLLTFTCANTMVTHLLVSKAIKQNQKMAKADPAMPHLAVLGNPEVQK